MKEVIYKNIIFDFGGVIIRIDYNKPIEAFKKLGIKDFEELYSKASQGTLFDDFEKALISPGQFREGLRTITGINMSDDEIDDAWNAILIDLPKENIELLRQLKKTHRLFLLSNTNAIHEKAFTEIIMRDYGRNVLYEVFEKVYFSHHLHMRKPDKEIFEHVLNENNLMPSETLFVDDSPQHIEGAKKASLQTLLIEKGITVGNYFSIINDNQ